MNSPAKILLVEDDLGIVATLRACWLKMAMRWPSRQPVKPA